LILLMVPIKQKKFNPDEIGFAFHWAGRKNLDRRLG